MRSTLLLLMILPVAACTIQTDPQTAHPGLAYRSAATAGEPTVDDSRPDDMRNDDAPPDTVAVDEVPPETEAVADPPPTSADPEEVVTQLFEKIADACSAGDHGDVLALFVDANTGSEECMMLAEILNDEENAGFFVDSYMVEEEDGITIHFLEVAVQYRMGGAALFSVRFVNIDGAYLYESGEMY